MQEFSSTIGSSKSNSSSEDAKIFKRTTDSDLAEEFYAFPTKRRHQRTKSAAKLVSKVSLPTRKALTVLQSRIWCRVMKDVEKVKNRLKKIIGKEKFCLHFDSKRIRHREFQVVCLKIVPEL